MRLAPANNVTGTVAKLEWMKLHAFLWVYAPSSAKPARTTSGASENGSPSVLQVHGWSKDVLKAVTISPWRSAFWDEDDRRALREGDAC